MDCGADRVTTTAPHFSKKDKNMAERKVWNDATRLTPKEQQVYDLFRKGFKAKDIAVILSISPSAARTRLALAKDKVRHGGTV
jgi:DNA-binding CsgD family transcriptional regulator